MGAGIIARECINTAPYSQSMRDATLSRPLSAYAPGKGSTDAGGGRSDVDLRPLETFFTSLKLLREEFVEPIQQAREKDMAYGSIRSMLDSLQDPLTRFYEPEMVSILQDASDGKFYGIGAVIKVAQNKQDGIIEEKLAVVSTLPGSPARKAELVTGDIITEIDGNSILPYDPLQRVEKLVKDARNGAVDREKLTKILEAESERIKNGVTFQKALDMLSGKDTKEMTLTVVRANTKNPLKIKIKPELTAVDPVTYSSPTPSVGYVHINLLNKLSEPKFAEAVADFKKRQVKGIVLDLRDSPGGQMDSARAVAGDFLYDNTFSVLQMPKAKKRVLKTLPPHSHSSVWSGPVVVLVNGGTSGNSEVLAAVLHDNAFAKLVGSSTAGLNMQQTLVQLKDGSAFTMTTGKYLTVKGVDYNGKGIQADVQVPSGGQKNGQDPQLTKAIDLIAAGKGKG
jgi:carboxyl-terminal processing protease